MNELSLSAHRNHALVIIICWFKYNQFVLFDIFTTKCSTYIYIIIILDDERKNNNFVWAKNVIYMLFLRQCYSIRLFLVIKMMIFLCSLRKYSKIELKKMKKRFWINFYIFLSNFVYRIVLSRLNCPKWIVHVVQV